MYEVLRNRLINGQYTLEDAEGRINYFVAAGEITPEQAVELRAIAIERADPGAGGLRAEVAALRVQVDELRQGAEERARESMISLLAITELYEMMIGGM